MGQFAKSAEPCFQGENGRSAFGNNREDWDYDSGLSAGQSSQSARLKTVFGGDSVHTIQRALCFRQDMRSAFPWF